MSKPGRKLWFAVGAVIAGGILFLVGDILTGFGFTRDTELDIHSGRVRFQRTACWIPLEPEIEDTCVSEELNGEVVIGDEAEWVLCEEQRGLLVRRITMSPIRYRQRRYASHLVEIWSVAEFTPEARRESAYQLVRSWQSGLPRDRSFLTKLRAVAEDHARSSGVVGAEDVPEVRID